MPFGSHHGISRRWAALACAAGLAGLAGSPAAAQLDRFYEATGAVSVSVNAGGSTDDAHAIVIDKPSATAQVVRVYVMAASRDGRTINPRDVAIGGQPITWDREVFVFRANFPNFFSHNVLAELTATIGPVIDAADPGPVPFVFTEAGSSTIEGEVLVVVFADPEGQSEERTVWLAFGGPGPEGDELVLNLKDPIDPEAPGALADFGLGIASSVHGDPDTTPAIRRVLVDGEPLTSAAGGQDDGTAAAGSQITAGGRGDDDANPDDPAAPPGADPRQDDELYSLLPFLSNETTQVRVTTDAGDFDNLFFAYFVLSDFGALGSGVFLDPETAVNEVGTDHTVTATAFDGQGAAAPGVNLTFSVIAGPNAGTAEAVTTGADGTASFTYTGDGGTGTDAIVATFFDQAQQPIGSNIATKQWIFSTVIVLAPEAAVNEVGSDHTVTAAVSDLDGAPQEGVEVSFDVLSGPNEGTTGAAATDADGMASFTYEGTGGAGVDEIVASLVDAQGNTVTSNAVTKEWVLPVSIDISPTAAANAIFARQMVFASLTDSEGAPQEGVEVTFAVTSGPNAGAGASLLTGEDGLAEFTYLGAGGPGLDRVEASFVDALGVTRTSDAVPVEWLTPPVLDPRPDLASSGDGEVLVVRELGAGLTGIAADLLGVQGGGVIGELLTDGDAVYALPSVARLANGSYVAVFLRGRPLEHALVGRFIGADGLAAGSLFVIDGTGEICDGDPAFDCPLLHPDVAALPGGGFVVVWERRGAILGGIFDAAGNAVSGTFTVADIPNGFRSFENPEVAGLAGGSFAVAYRTLPVDGSEIRTARFDARGNLVADVSASLFDETPDRPAIAVRPGGRPVVLWESFGLTGGGIFGRVDPEDSDRPQFQVNTSIAGDQVAPAIAVEPSGLVAAVWLDAERGVLAAQRFSPDLIFVGGELDLAPSVLLGSDASPPVLGRPRAVALADGTLAVVAGIGSDDADPDGGAAVAFSRPTPLAACFEDGRLVARTSRLECVKLRIQSQKRIRRLAGGGER